MYLRVGECSALEKIGAKEKTKQRRALCIPKYEIVSSAPRNNGLIGSDEIKEIARKIITQSIGILK